MTKVQILKFNKDYRIYDSFKLVKNLPKKVLSLEEGAFGALYLTEKEDFVLPSKVYSNDSEFISHVVNSFNLLNKNVGILLQGKKGLGKTFTAKLICNKLNLPVIMVNKQTHQGMFDFLNQIDQPHIIYIDEFEKLFPEKRDDHHEIIQNDFLTFLDGSTTNNVKRLFIITSNKEVNEYLMNRPSRVRYVRNYDKIAESVISEIIEDKLVNKSFGEDLIKSLATDDLNIDSLLEIIEEINTSNKPYSTFREYFNYHTKTYNYEYFLIKEDNTLELINTRTYSEDQYKQYGLKSYIDCDESTYYGRGLISSSIEGDLMKASWYTQDSKGKDITKEVRFIIKREFNKLNYVF